MEAARRGLPNRLMVTGHAQWPAVRARARRELAALVTLVALGASQARAQHNVRRVSLLDMAPSTSPDGVLTADPAATPGHLRWSAALWLGYANDPLRVTQGGATVYKLVHDQVRLDLLFTVGIWEYVEIGLHLPVVVFQDEEGDPAAAGDPDPLDETAVGDFRVVPKVRFWKNTRHGFGLALALPLGLPSGMSLANVSDGRVSFAPKVVLDYRFRQGALVTLNLGYRLRRQVQVANLRVDDQFYYALGAEVPVWRRQLSVLAELYGAVGFTDTPLDPDRGVDAEEAPLEAALRVRYRAPFGLMVTAAAAVGVTGGFGVPDYRVLLGVGYRAPARAGQRLPPAAPRPWQTQEGP